MTILFAVLAALFFTTTCLLIWPWIKRKYIIRKYRDEYHSAESKMEQVYVARSGEKIFTFKNPLDLPPKRAIRAEVAARMSRLCLTEKMFDEYVHAMKIACNKKDLAQVGYLVGRMEERRLLPAEENTLKGLADALFMIEGENPKATSSYWLAKKQKLWEEDEELYAFFLHGAMMFIRDISEVSAGDFLHSLQIQAIEKSLNRL